MYCGNSQYSVTTYLLVDDDDARHEGQIENEASSHAQYEVPCWADDHALLHVVAPSAQF